MENRAEKPGCASCIFKRAAHHGFSAAKPPELVSRCHKCHVQAIVYRHRHRACCGTILQIPDNAKSIVTPDIAALEIVLAPVERDFIGNCIQFGDGSTGLVNAQNGDQVGTLLFRK